MAKNQKKYTQEFKQQIVDLYNSGKAQWTRTQIHHYIIITCVTII